MRKHEPALTKRGNNQLDGDEDSRPVSWETAQEEASKWLGELKLGRDLFGKLVDISDKGETLNFTGRFREMVLEATRRKLVKRGAKDIIMPL